MLSDHDRRELFEAAEQAFGPRQARTLMELLPPVGWTDVARKSDIDALRAELKGEISELRAELVATAARLDGKIDSIVPKLIATNIASMIGVAGLVLAATQLA